MSTQTQSDADYSDEWMKGEESNAPATNAVKTAAASSADTMDKAYSDAWNENGPGESDPTQTSGNQTKPAAPEKSPGAGLAPKTDSEPDGSVSTPAPTATSPSSDGKTFKQAFAEARQRGDKVFEYNGKKYTTELASPNKASTSSPAEKQAAAQIAKTAPSKPILAPAGSAPSRIVPSTVGKANLQAAMADQKNSFMGGSK